MPDDEPEVTPMPMPVFPPWLIEQMKQDITDNIMQPSILMIHLAERQAIEHGEWPWHRVFRRWLRIHRTSIRVRTMSRLHTILFHSGRYCDHDDW